MKFSDVNECLAVPSDDNCSFGESNLVQRWYFDTKEMKCQNFLYDIQCGSSNGNVFLTKHKCEAKCL